MPNGFGAAMLVWGAWLGCGEPDGADIRGPKPGAVEPPEAIEPEETGETGVSTEDTGPIEPPLDPCDGFGSPMPGGPPPIVPVLDVAAASTIAPEAEQNLGSSLALWEGTLFAGQPRLFGDSAVRVFSALDLADVGTWSSQGDYDGAGSSLAAADIDGDGLVELAIGRPLAGAYRGRVSLVRGIPAGVQDFVAVDDLTFTGEAFDIAGTDVALAALGADPLAVELLVSTTWGYDQPTGRILALDPNLSGDLVSADALRVMRVGSGPGRFAPIDLDGDGQLDVASAMVDGIGWFAGPWVADLTETDRTAAWLGQVTNTALGLVVEDLGDIDGDGFDDLGLGSPGWSIGAVNHFGRAFVVEGSAAPMSGELDLLGFKVNGREDGEAMGGAMAGADVDGDGQLDLIVGAPGDWPGALPGGVLVYLGPVCPATRDADHAALIVQGEAALDGFGATLATGDLDLDGVDDLIIGALGAPAGAKNGAVHVVLGASLGL